MFNPNEATTRKALIDPALQRAGWQLDDTSQVRLEIPVDGFDQHAWAVLRTKLRRLAETGTPYNEKLPSGISDYALYQPNGEIIAVVEAKRTSIDPRLAQTQAEFYIEQIGQRQSFQPFAFMTNGKDIYFLPSLGSNKRLVTGFFSLADLQNQLYLRQNKQPLASAFINTTITDRSYQIEAIRRVCEAFDIQQKRKALLVMATGTGKTRTVMSLIDLFLRTNQARNILFVADRDALVQQAMDDGFRKFIPDEPCERIFTTHKSSTSRLYTVTLQTLNMPACLNSFTPGFFDLIIFDEVHRSIFNKWNEAFQYFDARIIGLTATPADFIDRNTFLTFECDNTTPTFLYGYKQAVQDGYLVDYDLRVARTHFQRQGIKGADLDEVARNALIEQGIDPDEVDFEGTELEKTVSNTDTLRKQWQEIWDECYKDASGQLPGKTIIFAMTQKHALRLEEVFNEMFPIHAGLVRVITHKSDHKNNLINAFKHSDIPRIAITVDLLETGVDIPEVTNLVFMKPVQSRIKLEQMIGRGTRSQAACHNLDLLPNREKKRFLVLDFWQNDFKKSASDELRQSLPVLVSLFNTRLRLLEEYLKSGVHRAESDETIARLRAQIERIPRDSFSVKKSSEDLEQVDANPFWQRLSSEKIAFLKLKIGPLLRYVPSVDLEGTTFTHKIERLKLQNLLGNEDQALSDSIADDVSRLPNFVFENPDTQTIANLCLTPPQLLHATPQQLDEAIDLLAGQMRNKRDRANPFLQLDLPDYVDMHGYIELQSGGEHVYVDEYRKRVENRIFQLIDNNPTIDAISKQQPVTDEQLIELEHLLHENLDGGNIELTPEHVRIAYGIRVSSLLEFLRNQLELDAIPDYDEVIHRQFSAYISQYPFTAEQTNFLRMIEQTFIQRHRLQPADLYDQPFTTFGADAIERLFSTQQISEILQLTRHLAA